MEISEKKLQSLAYAIEKEKCVLFLGPSVLVNEKGESPQTVFFQQLANDNPDDIAYYHPHDSLLVFKKGGKARLSNEIHEFFEQNFAYSLLQRIAEIPFHIIITLTPDLTLVNANRELSLSCMHNFFNKNSGNNVLDVNNPPTQNQPLIYNLFGSYNDDDSLILTHQDSFEYIQMFLGNINLLSSLRTLISKANYLLFLGVEFERWYFQLVLSMLQLKSDDVVKYASHQITDWINDDISLRESESKVLTFAEEDKRLAKEHFDINFINQDVEMVVNALHKWFEEKDKRRKPEKAELQYNKVNILKLVNNAFGAVDFEMFCQMYYSDVFNQFASDQSRIKRTSILIDHVERRRGFGELLKLVADQNKAQYENCKPYETN